MGSKFTIKGALMFVAMVGVSLAVLKVADNLSGGVLSNVGAR